jgi:hypothetical protein
LSKAEPEYHRDMLRAQEWAAISVVRGKFPLGWRQMPRECEFWGIDISTGHNQWLVPIEGAMRSLFRDEIAEQDLLYHLYKQHGMNPADAGNLPLEKLAELLRADCAEEPKTVPSEKQPCPDSSEDKVLRALALLAQIGPNASEIARKVGMPRTTLLSHRSFKDALELMRARGEAARRTRRTGKRVGERDFTTDD